MLVTGATTNADRTFVTQQAKNLAFDRDDATTRMRYLVRDRNQKFTRSFDEVFETEGPGDSHLGPTPKGQRLRSSDG